jgi:hypothetical protein
MIMKLGNGVGISGAPMHASMHAHVHTRAPTQRNVTEKSLAGKERKGKVLALAGAVAPPTVGSESISI